MSRTTRRALVRTGALVLTAALGLSACAGDPLRSGAAAVVGDERITTAALADLTAEALEDPAAAQRYTATPQARQDFERQELGRLVNSRLLELLAVREGVEVSDGDVETVLADLAEQSGGTETLVQRAAENGLPGEELRAFARDLALQAAIGDSLTADVEVSDAELQTAYDANLARYDQVKTAHIVVEDKALSDSILAQVQADPTRFAALAAEFSTDTNNANDGGDLGYAGRGAFVAPFEDAVFAAQVGDVVQVETEFGFHVVRVDDRRTTSLAEASEELRRGLLEEQRAGLLAEALVSLAAEVGVRVSPRFGSYDPALGAVTERDRPAISPAPGGATVPGLP